MVLGKWDETRTVYDYFQGVEVCLYHTSARAKAMIVDPEGKIGVLEIDYEGHLMDQKGLRGAWYITRNGRTIKHSAK